MTDVFFLNLLLIQNQKFLIEITVSLIIFNIKKEKITVF